MYRSVFFVLCKASSRWGNFRSVKRGQGGLCTLLLLLCLTKYTILFLNRCQWPPPQIVSGTFLNIGFSTVSVHLLMFVMKGETISKRWCVYFQWCVWGNLSNFPSFGIRRNLNSISQLLRMKLGFRLALTSCQFNHFNNFWILETRPRA